MLSTFLFLDQIVWLGRTGIYKVTTAPFILIYLFMDDPTAIARVENFENDIVGIQNKERAELIGRISLFCWLGSSVCATLVEVIVLPIFI